MLILLYNESVINYKTNQTQRKGERSMEHSTITVFELAHLCERYPIAVVIEDGDISDVIIEKEES